MAAEPPVASPPGWYQDPLGRRAFRWWDGREWTGYVGDTAVEWDDPSSPTADRSEAGLPGFWTAVMGAIVGAGFSLAVSYILDRAGRPGGLAFLLAASQLALWSGLLGAVFVVSRRRGTGSIRRDLRWSIRWRDLGFGLAGSLVARVMAGVAASPIPIPFSELDRPQRSIFEDVVGDTAGWVVLVVLVCVGAPLIEELFFRGLLQPRLVERFGAVWGIGLTSVLFGAAHVTAWDGSFTVILAAAVTGAGVVLGVLRHLTGTLGAATMAHAFFNVQAVLATALLS